MIFKRISVLVPSNYSGSSFRTDTVGLFLLRESTFHITDLYMHEMKSHRKIISDLSGEVREKSFYKFGML